MVEEVSSRSRSRPIVGTGHAGLKKILLEAGWLLMGCGVVVADYASGPAIHFPVVHLLPICAAAWLSGPPWAVFLSLTLPLSRIFFGPKWGGATMPAELYNYLIQAGVFVLISLLIVKIARLAARLARRVKVLEGVLPVCAFCKKIRMPDDSWVQIEAYIRDNSEAKFTHTYCPTCFQANYSDLMDVGALPGDDGARRGSSSTER